MSNNLVVLKNEIFRQQAQFDRVLTDKSIRFESEAGFAMQLLGGNNYLAGIAMSSKQSLANAITNIAAIGISLNPAKKQAYLVPRDGKVCLDISYMGLMDLAMATGAIMWGQAIIVRKNDRFALVGLDQKPHHEYNPFAGAGARGEIVGVYVVVKTAAGDYLTHPMATDAVYAIRDRSSAWKAYKEKGKSCPWVTDEEEMIKKTCVKQAYKYWPKNSRLEEAIHHLNTDGGEGIDFKQEQPARPAPTSQTGREGKDVDEAIAKLKEIAKGGVEEFLTAEWQRIGKDMRKAIGATRWAEIKALLESQPAEFVEVVECQQ